MIIQKLIAGALLSAAFATTAIAAPGEPVCQALATLGETSPSQDHLEGLFIGLDGFMYAPNQDLKPLQDRDVEPLLRLGQALADKGTRLVYVVLPDRALVYPDSLSSEMRALHGYDLAASEEEYYSVLRRLNEGGILAPDLLTPLRSAAESRQVYFKRDAHWTSYGSQAVANAIAEAIRADAGFPDSGLEFETTQLPSTTQIGSFARLASKLCGGSMGVEEVARFVTMSRSSVGLLDDAPPPKIALAGTSYSLMRGEDFFNFAGFLREYTGEDVVNFAASGGGVFSAMSNLLSSEYFHETPPAYLVWEQNRGIKTISDQISRQMIAMSRGLDCEGVATVIPAQQGEKVTLASNLPLLGPTHYLTLQYDDLAVAIHRIKLTYADGKSEKLVMDKGSRAEIDGRFAIELSRKNTSGLVEFAIEQLPSEITGNVTVKVCSAAKPSA